VLEGLPDVFEWAISLVKQRRRGSLQIVIYHLLGDVVNAADVALTRYGSLAQREPYSEQSRVGTAYEKWAKSANDDFEKLDACVRRLLLAVGNWYEQTMDRSGGWEEAACQYAWQWFNSAEHRYASCVVDARKPALTLAAITVGGWVEQSSGRFIFGGAGRPVDSHGEYQIVAESVHDISERGTAMALQREGLRRLEEMRALNAGFAEWLRAECTLEEVTAPHDGTLSNDLLGDGRKGSWRRDWSRPRAATPKPEPPSGDIDGVRGVEWAATSDVTCAVCGTVSRQLRMIATGTWAGTHLDGRTTGMGEGTLGRWIDRCPGCGYRAASIARAPAAAAKAVRSRAYRRLLIDPAMPMVARWYVCAAMVAEADGARASRAVVEYLLHAAWACDDAGDVDAASDCRNRTVAALQALHEAGDRYRFDDASADWALLADLHRRSGRLLEAGEAARAGRELADSPFFRRLLELQLRLAELCDTDAHLYEEAVADAGVEPGEQVVGDT